MVWLYWLQDRYSIPNWYTINHPTALHTQNETQWPTAARRWHFALRDVSRKQSYHFLTPSHSQVPPGLLKTVQIFFLIWVVIFSEFDILKMPTTWKWKYYAICHWFKYPSESHRKFSFRENNTFAKTIGLFLHVKCCWWLLKNWQKMSKNVDL